MAGLDSKLSSQDPSDQSNDTKINLPEGVKVWDISARLLPHGEDEPIEMMKGAMERISVDPALLEGEGYVKFRQPGASGDQELLPLAVVGAGAGDRKTNFILVSYKLYEADGEIPQRNVFGLIEPLKDGGYSYTTIPSTDEGDLKFINAGRAFNRGKTMNDEDNPGLFDGTTSGMHFALGASTEGVLYVRDMNPSNGTYLHGADGHPAVETFKLASQVTPTLGKVALNS